MVKKYFLSGVPAGYLKFISWLIVGITMLVSLKTHPLSSAMHGDETNYYAELDYLVHYGFYNSLAQGTSLGYTLILFILSKIIPLSWLTVMKLCSAVSYVACCYVILKVFSRFQNIKYETRYLGMVFFSYCANGIIWRGLPDNTHALIIFIVAYILLGKTTYKSIVIAALLVFLAFIIKPVAIFYIPAILLYLLVNKRSVLTQRIIQIFLFTSIFSSCFVVYHIPGYKTYGKLMLEDKNHIYDGNKRVELSPNWNEINNYYEVYNPNKRENKWHVTIDEVKEFKKSNPDKLDLSYTQFLQQHFKIWAKNAAVKIFLDMPYNTDCGMFYHRWTIINKWIKNLLIIEFISLVLFIFFCYKEWELIRSNVFLVVPLTYFMILSLYVIPQLEGNWLISCLPFFALPIMQSLQRKIGTYIILLGQLLIVFL